jgi:hypothetical protein
VKAAYFGAVCVCALCEQPISEPAENAVIFESAAGGTKYLCPTCVRRVHLLAPREAPTIEAIQREVASDYGVRLRDLNGPRRHRAIAHPRMVAMYLARKLTSMSYPEIGRRFGGRDHSTVISAVRKIERLCATDPDPAEGFPAGGAMENTAGGRNGLPTATVSPESLPPQLLIQDGELLVRWRGRAPVPLTTWLARWLARASVQRARSAEIRPVPGDAGDAANGSGSGGVSHAR